MGLFKEFYLSEWKSEVIATYLTRSGKVAFEVKKDVFSSGKIGYSYMGKHGAGSGGSLKNIANSIKTTMQSRKGIYFSSGIDITKEENLKQFE